MSLEGHLFSPAVVEQQAISVESWTSLFCGILQSSSIKKERCCVVAQRFATNNTYIYLKGSQKLPGVSLHEVLNSAFQRKWKNFSNRAPISFL